MTTIVLLELHLADDAVDADAILRETLAQTRAFAGNEGISILVDEDDPRRVVVEEVWADADAQAAYSAWRATPEGRARLGEVLAGPPVLRRFAPAVVL